ncbi:GGDEF domain-containing protein [Nocardia sp. CDC153]|uniref:GGDEF domain-containing protein n=1 Tax=Nocardia sp. CDC153 TaxID=3112167 RepID=UPI002DBA968D|nr:GGDEF domain-containing protein [Nocardia sp. CDC153]MEC3957006.1 GGDEF domain-containing protein [Nocardia sp. CDC153]
MTDARSLYRTWWRDRVDYRWLVDTLQSHSALRGFKIMLGAGGIVMLLIAVLAALAQSEVSGPLGWQGALEATVAGLWTLRWWLLPWPREVESLVWIVLFDLDTAANDLLARDRVIAVLGIVLLMAMGGYVTVFHGPRVLALHVAWSILVTVMLATLIALGYLPATGRGESHTHGRFQDLALGLDIILVMVVVVGVILPFVQLGHWIVRVDALSDPLTKLLNRRGLDSYLAARIGRSERRSAYVASLDLDRFKTINDTFGHPFGDEVLVRTAQRLRDTVESDALVARTGGEEFVVVGYLRDNPAALAEGLRAAIETTPDLPVTITASIGVAIIEASHADSEWTESSLRRLLHRADSAMYRAKGLGGNTFVITDSDGVEPLERKKPPTEIFDRELLVVRHQGLEPRTR